MFDIEFKELENGWIKRCLINAFKSFLNPCNIFLIILFIGSIYVFPPLLILFVSIFSFSACYAYFYKEKNNTQNYLSAHYFKTFLNTIKNQKSFKVDSFIVFIFLLFKIISGFLVSNTGNDLNESSSDLEISIILSSFLFIFMLILTNLYSLFKSFLLSFYYFLLMKSNCIFLNFSNIDEWFNKEQSSNVIIKKIDESNKFLLSKLLYISIIMSGFIFLCVSLVSYFVFLPSNLLLALFISLFISANAFFLFNVMKELIDGNKDKVKLTELKIAKEM